MCGTGDGASVVRLWHLMQDRGAFVGMPPAGGGLERSALGSMQRFAKAAGSESMPGAPPAILFPACDDPSERGVGLRVVAGPPRVLLVEDDPEMSRLVQQALVDEGYVVEAAADGAVALEVIRRRAFEAVILDVLLPGLDGRAVCRTLREEGRLVPVMMLTALGEVVDRVQGLDLGADDYLAKPFSLEEFLARLRALVRRGEQQRPELLKVGALRLDRMTGRAWRGEVEVELTGREAALLELFMRWPGIVLARDTLLAHVWGDEPGKSSNLVTQYVGHLRRKFGMPYGGVDLETVHRVGYRLTARERG